MDYLTRIDVTKIDFGSRPDQRVLKVTAALNEQRANLRAATDPHNRDVATRNVADLKQALERAEANETAWQKNTQEIEAARAAKQQEHDDRALAAITDQLRRDYLSQPGTTEADFEQALPRLLERQREDAALNAPAVFERQVSEARQRMGRFF